MPAKDRILNEFEDNPDFEIKGFFSNLANDDFERAVQVARGFQAEAARANATIAIARAVLEQNGTPLITPRAAANE